MRLRISLCAAHGGHLRHHRGAETRLSRRRSGLVQPRAGAARDGTAAGRAGARPRRDDRRRRPGVRADSRDLGAAGSHRRPLQPALPAWHSLEIQRRERQRLGRWARGAHTRGRQPGPRQPRAFPPRLHRLRGAARHLQGVHRDPDPARGRARVRVLHRRPAPRGARPRPGGAAAVEPVQPDRQAHSRRRAGALGRDGARARLRAADRRVLFALPLVGRRRRPGRRSPSRAPRATSRTSTAIRWSCSTG